MYSHYQTTFSLFISSSICLFLMSLVPTAPIFRPNHHPPKHSCEVCDYSSTDRAKMAVHYRLHAAGEEYRYRCPFCHVLISDKNMWITHTMSGQHAGERAKLSESDLKSLMAGNQGLKSWSVADDEDSEVYTCRTCGEQATGESNMAQHALTHFTATPLSKCPHCNYSAALTQEDIYKHIMQIHTEASIAMQPSTTSVSEMASPDGSALTEKKKKGLQYACCECAYQCSAKRMMEAHVRSHQSKPQYQCPFCKLPCQNPSTRKLHMFRMHTDTVFSTPDDELAVMLAAKTFIPTAPVTEPCAVLPPQRAKMPHNLSLRTAASTSIKQRMAPERATKVQPSSGLTVPIDVQTQVSNRVTKPQKRVSVYRQSVINDDAPKISTRGRYACDHCAFRTDVDYELLVHKRSRSCLLDKDQWPKKELPFLNYTKLYHSVAQ